MVCGVQKTSVAAPAENTEDTIFGKKSRVGVRGIINLVVKAALCHLITLQHQATALMFLTSIITELLQLIALQAFLRKAAARGDILFLLITTVPFLQPAIWNAQPLTPEKHPVN